MVEPGNTAENVFCTSPTDSDSLACSERSLFTTATTLDESNPPERQVPTGTSAMSRRCIESIKRSLNVSISSFTSGLVFFCSMAVSMSFSNVENICLLMVLFSTISICPGMRWYTPSKNVSS